jgi:two-component system KDP operon response regulator KdpE
VTPKVVIIDDEREIHDFLRVLLPSNGFETVHAFSGEEGLSLVKESKPDLVVLDLGLPGMDGIQTLAKMRKESQIPILILSVRDREDDKVKGLECGADDYLTKPFGAKELVARLRVLLRKHVVNRKPANLDYGRLQIDKEKRQVTINGAQLKLSDTEYKLLLVLADNPGKLFTHRELLRAVWEGNVSEHVEYLRVYINHLRQKLEEQPSRPVLILTEPGIGYRFRLTLPQ